MDRPGSEDPFLKPGFRPIRSDIKKLKERVKYYEFRFEILQQQELEFIQSEKQQVNGMTWKVLQDRMAADRSAIRTLKEHIQLAEALALQDEVEGALNPGQRRKNVSPAAARRDDDWPEPPFWPAAGGSSGVGPNISVPAPIPRSQQITEPVVLTPEDFFKLYILPYKELSVTCNGVPLENIAPVIPKEFLQTGVNFIKLIKRSHFNVMDCHTSDNSISLTFHSSYKSTEPREDGISGTVREFCREVVEFLRSRRGKAEMEIRFDRADMIGYMIITATSDMATVLCMDPFVEEVIS